MGSKVVWNFPENSPVLVPSPVPKIPKISNLKIFDDCMNGRFFALNFFSEGSI